jgi:hypothetical protein
MLHACVERFDVMGGRGNILGCDGEVNKVLVNYCSSLRKFISHNEVDLDDPNCVFG